MSGAKRGYVKLHYDTVSTKKARINGERMWRDLPPNTRGLTARICGDPLPRSLRSGQAQKWLGGNRQISDSAFVRSLSLPSPSGISRRGFCV